MNRFWRHASALLGVLSGSGCVVSQPDYGAPVPMYGVWDTAWQESYHLSGATVDASTQQSIEGIQLRFGGDVTRSDADGHWLLDPPYPCEGDGCTLTAEDVDGPASGSYLDAEVDLSEAVPWSDLTVELQPADQ